ncbi:MAG: ABC transporter permease [Caldilineaceae bacterium SB0670_bin_27]|uniref:ABC transporter permease n=1 Tax=Caldilineaceae bacterium SB0664_bin_27 TaxID=2605260 RepID=A0A6B0YMY1_9CHLR|nr:ABC transporter permease [Caldilineaceae bacterium SB0664_bin_27]MYJ80075.1 ABC transporter permease [Caldilineaceae bacterium SB0670_bin_27]
MRSILTIILNDLKIYSSQRGNLVGLLVIPVLLTVVIGWSLGRIGGGGPTRLRVDLIDLDGSDMSAQLIEELRAANDALVLCPPDNDADDYCRLEDEPLDMDRAIERARSGRTSALIAIPAGYAAALNDFQTVTIDYYSRSDPMQPGPVLQSLNAVLQRTSSASMTKGVSSALLDNLTNAVTLPALDGETRDSFLNTIYHRALQLSTYQPPAVLFRVVDANEDESGIDNGFNQSAPGMGSLYVMFTVLGGMAVLLRERRQWTLQRLMALPLSRAQILGAKIGVYFTLGMIQFFIVFAVGAAFGMDFGSSPPALLATMAAFVLCITALTFALAPWIKSEGQANGLVLLLSLSLAPLGGAWWPLEIVPEFMQTIGHLSPVAWAMDAFQDLIWYDGGFTEVIPEIAVLMAAAAVLFIIGIRSFKYD